MKNLLVLIAFVCALAASSFAQTASDITVSGTLFTSFNDPCANCTFTVTVTRRDGVAIQSVPRTVTANGSGVVSFTLPRKSFATFLGQIVIGRYNLRSGISMFLPDQSTIDLVDIQSVEDAAAALVAVSAAPSDAQYIVATANGTLSAEQSLGALTTGLLKNTVSGSTGTLSTAVAGTDYQAPISTASAARITFSANTVDLATTAVTPGSYTAADITVDAYGRITAASNGAGGGTVSSVFGRTGAVVAATNDYTWAQIDKTTSSLADIATRSASDLSSGTLAAARGGAGTVNGILKADGAGLVSAASAGTDYEVPLTFSTGLTRSTNTITVNTSQNIATLSNLTSNGLVTTSGGAGTLGVTVPGTGVLTALAVNTGSAGAFVVNGGDAGTPSALVLTNATGLPLSTGVTGDLPFANFVQAGSAGFVGATGAGDYSHRTPAQVTAALDAFVGDSGSGGTKGLVPAPASGDAAAGKVLGAGGTWVAGGGGITIGTTTVTSGTATRLFYETAGNVVGQISGATSDGTNVTFGSGNLLATLPQFTTGIRDVNGNLMLGFSPTGSATQYLTIANNTATNAVSLTANAPATAASSQAGTPFNLTASAATAGDTNAGAAAGGSVTITAGNAARLTSGNANGGNINLVTGTGIGTGTAGQVVFPLGVNAAPSITFSTDTDTGLYGFGNNQFSWTLGGTAYGVFSLNSTIPELRMGQGGQIGWSNNSNALASFASGGFTSNAAGTVRCTNGSTGSCNGFILGTSTVGSVGTSGVSVLVVANGTAPTSSPADEFQLYSADSAAGDANAFARNEAGEINRLTGLAARNSSSFAKTSDTTLANITGLTRNVEASRAYAFTAVLQTTAAATGGVKFAVSGTATATSISYEGVLVDSGAIVNQTRATALDTAVCASTTSTAGTCTIRGVIVVNAAGTLTLQFAQNASDGDASTVLVNQYMQLIPIS